MSTSSPSSGLRAAGWWIATVAWMAVIFVLSSLPDSDASDPRRLNLGVYKLAHLVVYTVLGVLVAGATRRQNAPRAAWWAWVLLVLYAIGDEIHQAFVPGRTPLVTDVGIDSIGGLLGILGYLVRANIREGHERPFAALLGAQSWASGRDTIDDEGSAEERR